MNQTILDFVKFGGSWIIRGSFWITTEKGPSPRIVYWFDDGLNTEWIEHKARYTAKRFATQQEATVFAEENAERLERAMPK